MKRYLKIKQINIGILALLIAIVLPCNVKASEVKNPAIPRNHIPIEIPQINISLPTALDSTNIIPTIPIFASLHIQNRPSLKTNIDVKALYKQIKESSKSIHSTPTQLKMVRYLDLVKEFTPSQAGISVDPVKTIINIIQNNLTSDIKTVPPTVYQSRVKNNLGDSDTDGINTLIARGVSNFKGSSKNRRINIKVATEKMRGVVVKKGEIFSFNKYVGDVTALDGFVPEIVIKKDGLKPELGGGVCQVSSTIFRAVMASGMPITERKNHSFPVNHYAPQGTDATTYTGVVDFKFLNDTPASVMLWPYFPDEDTLVFDIYGTDDERIVEVKSPVKYGFQENGIFKTHWERTVQKLGEEIRTDDLISTYLPASWFKKEEKFVTATPTTQSESPTTETQPPPPDSSIPKTN